MYKTTYDNQTDIINACINLFLKRDIELDPTFSKGIFYKNTGIKRPKHCFDLYPQKGLDFVKKATAEKLPFKNNSMNNIMFDPPFLVGYTKEKPTGAMGKRFHGFRYIKDLWIWYDKCLVEFHRILKTGGFVIFKCQDTVSSGKQHWSHVYIMNRAMQLGFECDDLFLLLAKNRMIGHNHKNQKHARKFHSYFLVLRKL